MKVEAQDGVIYINIWTNYSIDEICIKRIKAWKKDGKGRMVTEWLSYSMDYTKSLVWYRMKSGINLKLLKAPGFKSK